MPAKIILRELVKRYGSVEAVSGVSFEVGDGEIFGLLGPNGAGKTSTLECIIGLRQPDGGAISLCGLDAATSREAIKRRIGAVLQSTALQDQITPREALKLFAAFYEKPAGIETLITRFSLGEKADARFESLSGGQRQRLALALAFVNNPEILFLDEPTAGLDPQSRRELHHSILKMKQEGLTVLLTTHYIEEAEQLCDRIAIIDHGRVIAIGPPAELIAKSKALPRITLRTAQPLDLDQLRKLPTVASAESIDGATQIKTGNIGRAVIDLAHFIDAQKTELLDLQVHRPSLEDVFIELTGATLRD